MRDPDTGIEIVDDRSGVGSHADFALELLEERLHVKYQCPQEYEESLGGDPVLRTERIENAGDVTIGEMTRQLGLEQYDRICYLYDYGDE